MATKAQRVAIVVGLPEMLRRQLEAEFSGRLLIKCVCMRRSGGFQLEGTAIYANQLIEQAADAAPTYADALIILLPYVSVPEEVRSLIQTLEALGVAVLRPTSSATSSGAKWPPRSPRLDKQFQDALLSAVCAVLGKLAPPEDNEVDERHQIACELIRGLATHSKMGPNNHSHEDDLWKSRGRRLGPGGKEEIVDWLIREGIIARKKNMSAGGKGWVYWISDAVRAEEFCPDLAPYFQ